MAAFVWIALIIIFIVVEIATVGLTSIWFAGGALAALLSCAVGLNGIGQFLVFTVVSLILLFFTRPWAMKYFKPHLVKTNYEEAIGQDVCVTETIDNIKGMGTAVLKGQEWTARSLEDNRIFEPGTIVRIKEIRGVTLYVIDSDSMPRMGAAAKQ